MSFTEKIDVLELLISLLHEHEEKLDTLVDKLEIIDHTIKNSPIQNHSNLYEGTLLETSSYNEILVVDDDENLALTFKLILNEAGFSVEIANTGSGALGMMEEKNYDLIIIDINLPDMLGSELAEVIEDNYYGTEYVYVTGYSRLAEDVSNYGESEVLMKPISPDTLIEVSTKHTEKITLKNKK